MRMGLYQTLHLKSLAKQKERDRCYVVRSKLVVESDGECCSFSLEDVVSVGCLIALVTF